ncbi:MAG: methyltransferase [Anaerolineae bacterium]
MGNTQYAIRNTQYAVRSLWRHLLRWRFLLFQRHRYDRLVVEEIAGTPILVLPDVFNPKLFRTGEFLVETLDSRLIPPDSTVLDMGTGSGVGAVFAARWARRVVAVDINPEAVRCARINALLHQVEDRVEVRQGDLFEPACGEQFDAVLFNPPFFRGEPRNDLERALWANDVVERFAAGLRDHLTPEGHALVILSSDGDVAGFLAACQINNLAADVVAERNLVSETLMAYCVKPSRAV